MYFFLNSANLICRGTDNSNYFRESLGLWNNENRLYALTLIGHTWQILNATLHPLQVLVQIRLCKQSRPRSDVANASSVDQDQALQYQTYQQEVKWTSSYFRASMVRNCPNLSGECTVHGAYYMYHSKDTASIEQRVETKFNSLYSRTSMARTSLGP